MKTLKGIEGEKRQREEIVREKREEQDTVVLLKLGIQQGFLSIELMIDN